MPEMSTETYIIPEATMLTIDSKASERRATEPDMTQAASFRAKMKSPPAKAVSAAFLLLKSHCKENTALLGVSISPKRHSISVKTKVKLRSRAIRISQNGK